MNHFTVDKFRWDNWLPAGFGIADLTALLAALAVLTAFLAIWNALRTNSAYDRRFAQIAQRKESLRRAAISNRRERPRLTPAGLMHEAVKRLNLLRSHHATEARVLLSRAGIRSREAMVRYLFARVTMPVVCASFALIDSYALHILPIPANLQLLCTAGASVFGFFLPGIYIKNVASRRAQKLQKGLPDALDLMVICAEAGLSLDATLMRVSRELEASWPDLAEEFGLTAAELTFLPDRRQAFDNLNARTNLSAVRGVINTLQQTAKFGTPLAHSLRVLAAEFRDARLIRAEEKAARLPALLTVPMILFILPTLFVVLMGPAALHIIDTFSGNKNGPQKVTVVSHSGGGEAKPGNDLPDVTEVNGDSNPAQPGHAKAGPPPVAIVTPGAASVVAGSATSADVDARVLASGFDHRVAIMPIDAPDAVSDPAAFAEIAQPIVPGIVHVALTAPATPGPYEIRLYYKSQYSPNFVVAARAPITVTAR